MLCHATVDDISFSLLICILIVVHLTTTTMVQHTTSTVHYLIHKVYDFANFALTIYLGCFEPAFSLVELNRAIISLS